MAFNKLDILNKMSKQIPEINEKVRQQQQAAQEIQLANQFLTQGGNETNVQQVGEAQAQLEGQSQLQTQDQTNKQLGAIDEQQTNLYASKIDQGLKQQSVENQINFDDYKQKAKEEAAARGNEISENLFNKKMGLDQEIADFEIAIGDKMLTERKEFKLGSIGKQLTSARQVADWKLSTAKNEIEFRQYALQIGREKDKVISLKKLIGEELKSRTANEYRLAEGKATNAMQQRMADLQNAQNEKIKKDANRKSAWLNGALGVAQIAVGVVLIWGGLFTGGVSAAAGGSLIASGAGTTAKAVGDYSQS